MGARPRVPRGGLPTPHPVKRRPPRKGTVGRMELDVDIFAKPSNVFEPYTACPKCKVADWHWLRAPKDTYEDQLKKWELNHETITISSFEGAVRVEHDPPPPERYAVIRTCRECKHEWGQR